MLKAIVPAAVLLLALPQAVPASEPPLKEIHRTLALDKDGRVSLDTYKGTVKVSAWNRPEVEILARVEADDGCGDAKYQAEMVRGTEISIEGRGDSVRILSDYDRVKDHSAWRFFFLSSCSALPFVHYTISMPPTARLTIKDYKSRIDVADLASDIRLSTYKGEVRLTGLAGSLELDTYKGEVRAAFTRMGGDSRFETHKGDIEITLPKDARFAVTADTGRRGRLDSDFPVLLRSSDRRGRDGHFDASVNGGGPTLSVITYRGSFRLRSS